MRKAYVLIVLLLGAIFLTGCATRKIDADVTHSVKVEGTNWWRFCDGPNAVMWTEGITDSDDDEIEAYVYDHYACAPDFYDDPEHVSPTAPGHGDDDGILEDDEED